jgi:hypothetical protein
MTTPTLRRLDDRERYWGLTWPGWVALLAGVGVLYGAIRLSPLQAKPTITIAVIALTFVGMVLHGVSGQALSPGRQLLAIVRYRRSPKLLALSERADRRGLVLDTAPSYLDSADDGSAGLDRYEPSGFESLSALDDLARADLHEDPDVLVGADEKRPADDDDWLRWL